MFTSVDLIEQAGGIDEPQAYVLFRYADKPTLDAMVLQYAGFAASWLKTRAGASVYASAALDSDVSNLFALGETYVACHFIFPILQSRKVTGSYYPLQEEDSARFEELIGVQWMKLAEDLLEPYLTVEEEGKPFALPVFRVGPGVTRTLDGSDGIPTEEAILEANLDIVRTLAVPF